MQKKRSNSLKVIFLLCGLLSATAAACLSIYYIYLQRERDQLRENSLPPVVYLTEPASGKEIPAGGYINVIASALSETPMTHIEVWLDGYLIETQLAISPQGQSPLFGLFTFPLPEGAHQIFVRAVNTKGVIGQSLPVNVFGTPGSGEPFIPVLVSPEQTLAGLAGLHGTDVETINSLNPGLAQNEPAAGSFIKVPPSTPSQTNPPAPKPGSPPLTIIEPAPLGTILDLLNPIIAQLPAAPVDLFAQSKGCQISLRWNDASSTEQRYEVWASAPNFAPRLLYKLNPADGGAVWFEFPAPQPGNLVVWVEAVNSAGHQVSNLAGILVESQCPTDAPTQLRIELLDVNSSSAYDKAYCYLSFEGAPHFRIPGDTTSFFDIKTGQANISTWDISKRQFILPVPPDGSLEIDGECLGWAGAALTKVGAFTGKFPVETWDNSSRIIQAGSLQLTIVLQLTGAPDPGAAKTTYINNDPNLFPPYNLRIEETGSDYSGDIDQTLWWDWNGKPTDIDGFMVYLNGLPYYKVNGSAERGISALLPYGCGHHIRWEVAATAGSNQSPLSAPLEFDQPACQMIATVKFLDITIGELWNPAGLLPVPGTVLPSQGSNCDTIGTYFAIYVNDMYWPAGYWYADLYSGPKTADITCGVYSFDQLLRLFPKYQGQKEPDTIRVMLKGDNPSLTIAYRFMFDNNWDEPTMLANNMKTISMPYEQWKNYQQTFVFENWGSYMAGYNIRNSVRISVSTEMTK